MRARADSNTAALIVNTPVTRGRPNGLGSPTLHENRPGTWGTRRDLADPRNVLGIASLSSGHTHLLPTARSRWEGNWEEPRARPHHPDR